ncbi:Retrovirus-related Pol polyprotein from transposon opus [Araneus ventricosus]|uniref:Retrovirus-related Pol polyprotein from transposon opus n=1 Tax=Araneus ventricosus TaxID=182803 RepID=A0A4Y2NF79_ARAVE|nr:Retrovirus-related Pol polyprotein from transposon opus [Araneus ventricosus]
MMHLGHLRPSKSNYASPLHMVPKKGTLNWRPVGDYRALNSQTLKDKYPIPCIADFTAELHESKIFSRIDLIKAYHQIPIHPEDIHKTAICTPFGLFESTRMQFGLCNASATFQRFIDEVTRGLPGVYAFVDDVLIASKNHEDHYQHLKTLFSRLDEYGLCINVSKCIFGTSTIDFLGFNLSENGIKPLPDKVKCILDFPKPDTLTQLRRFLGMFNFYRCFIPKATHILAPIVQFLEGHTNKKKSHSSVRKSFEHLKWNENAEQAFLAAKNAIAEATLLRHPIPGAQLSLWVDASDVAIGGTLSQLSQGKWEPIAFFSMKLNKSPLPPSEGQIYLLTIIDHSSRWPEAIPIPDMPAKTICRAIFDTWISRFRCPSVVTSDQGSQLRSSMFVQFTRMLGTQKIKTTPYHPISNGIVERFHRHLKSAIKAHENEKWSELITIILLGIRTAVKEDLQSSCSELVYGTTLRLPCDMIDVSDMPPCDIEFITELRHRMQHPLTAPIDSTSILH